MLLHKRMKSDDDDKRWRIAQKAETEYWDSTKEKWSTQNRRQHWQETLAHGFGLDYNFFNNKDVLEIGCGPSGIIFQLDNTKWRIGIEPMDMKYLLEEEWKRSIVRRGVGEELPFDNDSFDVVISFNNLDHCVNPGKVVREVRRVLKHEGDFLFWIYVLRDQYKFLRYLLNKLDTPHPYHFTYQEIVTMLKQNSFDIKHSVYNKGISLREHYSDKSLKSFLGNHIMSTLALSLKKTN
jgi:SAM-dependent methyltransferase